MIKFKSYTIFLSLFFVTVSFYSQTKAELERQRKKYKNEIIQLNKLLFSEQVKGKNALEDLNDLNQFAPGKPVTISLKHSDGLVDQILCNHSYNDTQITWFKAGSALNMLADKKL